ncbi:SDR family oxidoreductase [Actinopolymorpha sp. NPDC004070]|uniref:SDR family oxidoreductase n=1 Tax=Actinopolymorpha sp. NPDC004070 TaxID=3154548 RepID=UPI0033A940EE
MTTRKETAVPEEILVTGGTGLLGRLVVQHLLDEGARVRVMSRRPRPADDASPYAWATADLRSGAGVAEAVAGVAAVVHCATAFGRQAELQLVRTLVEAAGRGGSPHLLYTSIVGVDRIPLPYYKGKLAAEQLVQQSGLPHTVLRATQFHDLLRTVFAAAATAPVVMPVPDFRFQPVDAGEVAARLASLAVGEPVGRAPDFAGPEVRQAGEFAAAYLRASDRRRRILPVRLPGRTFRAYRSGAHLAPDQTVGKVTFEDYLAGIPDVRGRSYRQR